MSLGDHLVELRKRIVYAAIGIFLGMIAGWFLSKFVIDILREPILAITSEQGRQATLNYADITSAFDIRLQISLAVGIIISAPIWLYQIWAFLVPGLTRRERLYSVGFLGTAIPLFAAGCYAGWLVLPHIVAVMTSFASSEDGAVITARGYFDFVLKLVVAVGIAFVVPVFVVLLNFVGVLSAATIIKGWRVAILLIFVFTAIATPAVEVMSMFLLAAPMIVLYFAAWFIAWVHDRRVKKTADALELELAT